jgi:hypothetical protein
MFILMDTVDTSLAPVVMVARCSYHVVLLFSNSDIEMDGAIRTKLEFYSIPFEFLCRDDWADIEQQGGKPARKE